VGGGLSLQLGRSSRVRPGCLRFFDGSLLTLFRMEKTVDRVKYKIQKIRLTVFNFVQ